MASMIPDRLTKFMAKKGTVETYKAGDVFHSQDFAETLFMLSSGFAKRYQITTDNKRTIELIYGPGHIFPLSQLYKKLFGIEQNQANLVYVYQAMTDIEIISLNDDVVLSALDQDPLLYVDLFYEGGLRLKSNIERLASNALSDEYKKIAHQLASLAEEFGEVTSQSGKHSVTIPVPLESSDMAEQLNISLQVAEAVMANLIHGGYITSKDRIITIPDIALLKDIYL